MATDALSGMRRCLPALQAPYFHMASLSIVLLLMLLCAGCASDEEAEAPVPPQGEGRAPRRWLPSFFQAPQRF